jgi:hypothetical protein
VASKGSGVVHSSAGSGVDAEAENEAVAPAEVAPEGECEETGVVDWLRWCGVREKGVRRMRFGVVEPVTLTEAKDSGLRE